MQVLLFLGFMLILALAGFLCILISIINLVLRHRQKKCEQPLKRRNAVLASVFLASGIVLWSIPLLFFGIIRGGNLSMDAGYVDTGKYVEGGYQEGSFTVDGVYYQALVLEGAPFWSGPALNETRKAVFSWDSTPDGTMGLWYRIFGYYNRGNYYEIPNDAGVELISGGHSLFCPKDQVQTAMDWYSDPEHFGWYVSKEGDEKGSALPPLDEERINGLFAFSDRAISESRYELDSIIATMPSDQSLSYISLDLISQDGVVLKEGMLLDIYQDALYVAGTVTIDGKERSCTLYPLPTELNDYFSTLILPLL